MPQAIQFSVGASINGVSVPISGGTVLGRKNTPSMAQLNIAYGSIGAVTPKAPVVITATNGLSTTVLFEGQVSQIGREKSERGRSVTVTAEGYSNYWFRTQIYLMNEFGGLTYADSVRQRAVGDATGYTAGRRMSDIMTLFNGDLPGFIHSVLSRTSSPGGGAALSRLAVLSDPSAAALFKGSATFARVFEKMVIDQMSAQAPIMNFLFSIMNMLYYEFVDMVGPVPGGKRLMFKPRVFFTPPPSCNVFYPSRYGSVSESRALIDAPTRMCLQTNASLDRNPSGGIDISTIVRFAPPVLQARFEEINASGQHDPAALSAMLANAVTDEEKQRGIVSEYGTLTPGEWVLAGGGPGKSGFWLDNIAQYKLAIKQLEYRSCTINHSFHPDVALGFPGLLVDEVMPLIGVVDSVSHAFTTEGVSTSITMTHTRGANEAAPLNPPWVSDKFTDGSAYSSLLGSPSVSGVPSASTGTLAALRANSRSFK